MLPQELWRDACRFLDKKDLTQVSYTSSKLLAAARPILYQSVRLCSNGDGVQATLRLIKSDISLAHKTINLHIVTEWQKDYEASSWLDYGALSNLAQLRSLTMTASPFRTAEGQGSFLKILRRSCPLLKEFVYHQCRYSSPPFLPSPHPTTFPSDNFKIYGLEKLTWDDNACFAQPQLRSLMNASLPTISYLNLPSPLNNSGVGDAISFYQQFRFPSLRTFAIGDWIDFNGEAGPVALVEFLKAHPTIQDLSLDWEDTSEYTPKLSSGTITPDMLPDMQILHTHVYNILVLLDGGVRFLTNLTKLSVGHGAHPDADIQIDLMLKRLVTNGGLPRLRSLHFDPGESCSDLQKMHQWISHWSRICPGLKKWSGTLPDMGLNALISDFAGFPKLMRIKLAYITIPRGFDDVAKIISQLSSLRKVTIQPTGEYNVRRITYHIDRNNLGTTSQLVIRKYNLHNYQITTTYHNLV